MEVLGNQYDTLYERGIRTILPLGEVAVSRNITSYGEKFGSDEPREVTTEVDIEEPYETNGFGD